MIKPLYPLSCPASLLVTSPTDPQRELLEVYIRNRYTTVYGARLKGLMPTLLGLVNERGEVEGAAGIRLAAWEPLFLEHYLKAPIDHLLAKQAGEVDREGLVEVGNFCGSNPGEARSLVVALTALLDAAGLEWSLFTATRGLRNTFLRLRAPLIDLGPARPERLPDQGSGWGTYYKTDPRLGAIRLSELRARLWKQPLTDSLAHLWRQGQAAGLSLAREVVI